MITFTITEFPEKQIIGVLKDGNLIGTVYPTERGIEVVPNHLTPHPEQMVETTMNRERRIPALKINLIEEAKKGGENG